ncbi:MAG: C10 family peptidase [Prevotella sp.]|nr:C10 family peptidase [Prevotella sp.]
MRLKTISLSFMLMAATALYAAPVTQATAASKAKAFFANRKAIAEPRIALQGRQKIHGKSAKASNAYYYVFNNGDNDGYVIVSGDDETAPILGYADSGSFDASNVPDNMRAWLNGYAEQIERARAQQVKAANDAPTTARRVVEPLIATKWAQRNPFNQKCFTPSGNQAVAGCVATALAQIMYYHKWPRSSTTDIPAYSFQNGDSYDELPAITFDWDNMLLSYQGDETSDDPHAIAVADLLVYCGHAVKMSYGSSASGANDELCCNALVNYFGYGNTPMRLSRGSYNSTEWEEILYNELQHGRPVIYSGDSSDGGHAFICDGYDGKGFYHINWGWKGQSDGYFLLQVLNPAEQGTGGSNTDDGYTSMQAMTVGISPTPLNEELPMSNAQVVVKEFGLADGTDVTFDYSGDVFSSVSANYSFAVTIPSTYTLGFGLYQDDQLLQKSSFSTSEVTTSYTVSFLPFYFWGIGNGLSDGNYTIKCINKPDGAKVWQKNIGADIKYIKVTIADGKATLTNVVEPPQIEVISIEQRFDAGGRKQIRAYLRNNDASNFEGYFNLLLNDVIKSSEYVYIDGNAESFVDFIFTYSDTEPVNLKVKIASPSEILYEEDSFTFTTEPISVIQPEVLAYEVKNLDNTNKKMYGYVAMGTVKLKNTSDSNYTGDVKLTVNYGVEHTDDGRILFYSMGNSTRVKLLPGETKEVNVQIPGFTEGQEIWFNLSCADESYTIGNWNDLYTVTEGYTEWDSNGIATVKGMDSNITISENATAVNFQGLNLSEVTITPNSNPNTIYYLDGNTSTPDILGDKIVVKGSMVAGDVTLKEEYPYFVPADFDVTGTITFIHTPSMVLNSKKGWQTITLPFAVQQATADGNDIDWNRTETEYEKDFWVKRFIDVESNEAHFTNTAEWIPNEPYIIGFPTSLKGKEVRLTAKATKVFKSGTSVMLGSGYQLVGTGCDREVENAYVLNEDGDAFVRSANAFVKAGTAYFIAVATTDTDILRLGPNGLPGDVNNDGQVTVADVMLLLNYALGHNPTMFNEANADVNNDDNISISDVMVLLKLVISESESNPS